MNHGESIKTSDTAPRVPLVILLTLNQVFIHASITLWDMYHWVSPVNSERSVTCLDRVKWRSYFGVSLKSKMHLLGILKVNSRDSSRELLPFLTILMDKLKFRTFRIRISDSSVLKAVRTCIIKNASSIYWHLDYPKTDYSQKKTYFQQRC